jgi:hypothetical protein
MTWIWLMVLVCVCIVIGLLVHEVLTGKKPPYSGEGE